MSLAHPLFSELEIEQLNVDNFDRALEASEESLVVVFFWGLNCPNCEVAKNSLFQHANQVQSLGLKWYAVNVYDNQELGTKFGLHGVPTFFFFHRGRRLGRISPFPGMTPFLDALKKLRNDVALTPSLKTP